MTITSGSLTVAELGRLVRSANPGAILLPPRRLRRVIKEDRAISGLGLQVPHQQSYTITRERLLQLIPREELGTTPDQHLPATLLLLEATDPFWITSPPREWVLQHYWRLLFHARVHAALDRHIAEGRLTPQTVAVRISRIGSAAFSEIRLVLDQERRLLPPADELTIYVEFAALYLELQKFAPRLLPIYFPTIEDFAAIDSLLAEDVDPASLLAETRPEGVSEPSEIGAEHGEDPVRHPAVPPADNERLSLEARAVRAERKGNLVRTARMQQRAGNAEAARIALDRLMDRLQAALAIDDVEKANWRAAVEPLRVPASDGIWPIEARLLYDLQKVCIDRERPVYAVDIVEWAYSLGGRPVKRELPGQIECRQLKHLRSARRRAAATQIGKSDRHALESILETAVERAETRMRETFRPRIAEVLHDVGMRPGNVPEEVALHKVTEELLDRAVERGYLRMGDVRDAVSRNNLRLPDLSGPREFFRGDKLIRANRRLPVLLDGVYRRGEFYLRWLQRLSSLAFGTPVGRVLVLYLLLPFGGAFLTVEGIQHIVTLGAKFLVPQATGAAGTSADQTVSPSEEEHFHFGVVSATFILGLCFFGLIHSAHLRRVFVQLFSASGRGLQLLCIDVPTFIIRLPVVQWILSSRVILWFGRYVARPAGAGLILGAVSLLVLSPRESLVVGAAAFIAGCFFFSSRLAAELEEALLDWLASLWLRFSIDLIPALFHFVMAVFKRILEALDRLLYSIDEWLRFRTGDSQWTFVWKLMLGTLWFFVSYIIRLYVNLFIEPTTNPIKHFPVVTVSAKIMAPFLVKIIILMTQFLSPFMNTAAAAVIAGLHALILPGIFGFLAWELKENWRLYRKNQPKTLRPDVIGHHGETMHGLLKIGFHSGTIPKLYRKLRRAEQHRETSSGRRQRELLHHLEEAVRAFTERELIYLLDLSRAWGRVPIHVGRIRLGCSSIRVELIGSAGGSRESAILFEEQSGVLTATMTQPGWLETVNEGALRAFAAASAGWYQMAGAKTGDKVTETGVAPITWSEWLQTWENDRQDKSIASPFLRM
jgi:hypothetical protein